MPKAIISLNLGKFTATVRAAKDALPAFQRRAIAATAKAMFRYATDTVAAAQEKAAVRSGDLKASATVSDPQISSTTITCEGGFNSSYAAQRNFGGTIRAKAGGALTIPLDPALTASGVPKYSSPREIPGAFILKLWGRAFIAAEAGKGKNRILTLFYVLKDHVDQKGDFFFTSVVNARRSQAPGVIAGEVANEMGGQA